MDASKKYETLLVIVLALIIGFFYSHSVHAGRWLLAALIVGGLGVLVPRFALLVHLGWMRLSLFMGEIMGKVMLSIVYVFLLVPLAALARVFGHSGLKRKKGGASYFTERNHSYGKEDLSNPW